MSHEAKDEQPGYELDFIKGALPTYEVGVPTKYLGAVGVVHATDLSNARTIDIKGKCPVAEVWHNSIGKKIGSPVPR